MKKTSQDFPPESAGRLMTTRVPVVNLKATMATIEKLLNQEMKKLETINYVYVVDQKNKLKGAVSIKDVFRLAKSTPVTKAMTRELVSARAHTDQEQVALLALKHNLKAIPVVDKNNCLLGVVPSDMILSVLHNENIEDFLRFAGVHDPTTSLIQARTIVHFRKRFPWLLLGLLGGIVAAFVVESFETALQTQLILAAFIPVVVYMADAVGNQVQIIFIRSLALNHQLNLKKYILRETAVNFSIALVLGAVIAMIGWFWQHSILLGFILGSSIFATILAATAIAIFLPWAFTKMKADPAIASGPLATIIRDMLSLIIYFALAQAMLNIF